MAIDNTFKGAKREQKVKILQMKISESSIQTDGTSYTNDLYEKVKQRPLALKIKTEKKRKKKKSEIKT